LFYCNAIRLSTPFRCWFLPYLNIIIIMWLYNGRCHSHKHFPCLLILRLMIISYQTNVKWSNIGVNCPERSSTGWPDLRFQSLGKRATLNLRVRLWSILPLIQINPRCIAVLRDRCVYMTCVVGRAVCLGSIKVNIIIIIIIIIITKESQLEKMPTTTK